MMGILARRRNFARGLLLSVQILAAHRLRTLLSVSGLLIGVAAVMVMVAIGKGADRRLLELLGNDLDDFIAVPLHTAMRRILNIPYLHALHVQAVSSGQLEAHWSVTSAKSCAAAMLRDRVFQSPSSY